MTSEERREARYRRRTVKRQAAREKANAGQRTFEEVFSYEHLYRSYKKCCRNVGWKSSTQRYITQAPLMIYQTRQRLLNGSFRSDGFFEFDINERGKKRHIRSVTMRERVVQRCLCDHALVPALKRTFIYDNGASLEGKGYHFSIRRLCCHLQRHYRKYGAEGYILLFDFRKFFDNVDHALCKRIIRREIKDERTVQLAEHFIDMFGARGLGLGSQISQTLALSAGNRLDHAIKEDCRIKGYGRYMDDGYLIHISKPYLRVCLEKIRHICRELGIRLNEKKTHIVKLSHGFVWLKTRFYLLGTGKVLRKIYKNSVTRQRRKLKRLARLVKAGKMEQQDVYTSFQSWRAYAENFSAWGTIQRMGILFDRLFACPA